MQIINSEHLEMAVQFIIIYSVIIYWLPTYMPGIVLNTGITVVNKRYNLWSVT